MKTRAIYHERAEPVSSDTRATMACVILALAALMLFMTPHYVGVMLFEHGPLAVGDLPDGDLRVELWQTGDYAQLRHFRYDNGSTCTEIGSGPLDLTLCR